MACSCASYVSCINSFISLLLLQEHPDIPLLQKAFYTPILHNFTRKILLGLMRERSIEAAAQEPMLMCTCPNFYCLNNLTS